jgi:signal transduction histidine kinase
LGARLALFLLALALAGIVLVLLAGLESTGRTPAELRTTFSWIVLAGSIAIVLLIGGLRLLIVREVLRPLENIRTILQQKEEGEERDSARVGLGQVAATMRELRDTVDQTRAKLDESNRNLRQVEKLAMVGKLAAGVAHSVRNPLTSVKLRLFSLERGLSLTPQQQEDFAVIAQAIRHVDGIVTNFLEFSRRPHIHPQEIAPDSVVDDTLKLLENRLATFPVSIALHRAPKLPNIHGDPDQLREALLNILLNACEAMEYSGSLRIEESLYNNDGGGVYVRIAVQDSGPGIPDEYMADIFTPFFSTKEQGTGLGLPIARSILEEHGGDLFVTSSASAGAIFTLMLPVEGHIRTPK